jgi:hypothetical protein
VRDLNNYSEKHHIVPKCLGGSNRKENIVRLTPEEHYVAHQLLVRMYPGHAGLVFAVKMMTISNNRVIRNNKMFGWIKKILAEVQREVSRPPSHKGKKQSEEHIEKRISPLRGCIRSEESIRKQSEACKGRPGPRKGVKLSEDTKKLLSERCGRPQKKGIPRSEEVKRKISESVRLSNIKKKGM